MPGELRDKGTGERWSPPVDGRWTLRADLYVDCTGLRAKLNRRGIGYVYSAAHSTDDRAESVLRALNAPGQSR